MNRMSAAVFFAVISAAAVASAQSGVSQSLEAPDLKAEFAVGFNYDFLKSPLRVNYDQPRGFFGVNIPIRYTLDASITQNLTKDLSKQFSSGKEFAPEASARQYANTTIRVDMPMLGGVATFSNIQMMNLSYMNVLGEPNLVLSTPDSGDAAIGLFMRGVVSVPMEMGMSWETMNFGYARQVNKWLALAFNLHRNVFNFDVRGKVDIDMLGYVAPKFQGQEMGRQKLDYSLHNTIDGHYELERWTPTFAAKVWRVGAIARLGMSKAEPKGHLKARYSVPFFVDPQSFQTADITDNVYLTKNLSRFLNGDVNTVEYSSEKNMEWRMPHAFSFTFDIVPEKLSISYTKMAGDLGLSLYDPEVNQSSMSDTSQYRDTLDLSASFKVDNLIVLHGNFWNSFFNIGIYSMDVSFGDKENLLSNKDLKMIPYGGGAMVPILSLGALLGGKVQVLVEADVLPLTALKTGIVYNF